MFTGIIEQMGTVTALEEQAAGARLQVATGLASECDVGASVAVNGACLTVVARTGERLAFDLGPETLRSTALGELGPGRPVNLERPLRLGGPLGGHLVLGHVDGVGTITDVERAGSARIRVALPSAELEPLVILKGSVAVDGVSLTVAALGDLAFEVMVIPHTLAATTLGRAGPGGRVNLEMDVLGKYLLRALSLRGAS
ncbi:MAG: riboflavin synthase [Candidatus Rokuibacteriota bacterium]|nr:MAG: riboflavin synthase [Candidatus Rokubacteria bacterium]